MTSICKKKILGRSTIYSYKTNFFIEFHHFMKKKIKQLKIKQLKQNILNQWESMVFCELSGKKQNCV